LQQTSLRFPKFCGFESTSNLPSAAMRITPSRIDYLRNAIST
jgi:hypothetical protein